MQENKNFNLPPVRCMLVYKEMFCNVSFLAFQSLLTDTILFISFHSGFLLGRSHYCSKLFTIYKALVGLTVLLDFILVQFLT